MLRVFALALHQMAAVERSLLVLILLWGRDWLCRKLLSDCHDTEDAEDTVDDEDAESVAESQWW